MVKRSEFDSWMEKHRIKSLANETVDAIVGELLAGMAKN
jgi:hypothetical protein